MTVRDKIEAAVYNFFINTDARKWDKVGEVLAPEVQVDYTSLAGGEPALLSPDAVICSRKAVLPGFDHTHHQIGNLITRVSPRQDQAACFCYGTARHHITAAEEGSTWTTVGTYDIHLTPDTNGRWLIGMLRFNFQFADGNPKLPDIAKRRIKERARNA